MKKLILPRNQNVYKITHQRAGNARLQEKTRRHSTLYAITAHLLTPSSSTSSSLPRFAGSAQRQRRSRAQGQVPLSLSSSLPWCAHSLRARDFFPLSARFARSPSLDFSFFLSLLLFAPFFRRCSRPREISLYSLSLSLSPAGVRWRYAAQCFREITFSSVALTAGLISSGLRRASLSCVSVSSFALQVYMWLSIVFDTVEL